MLVVVGTVGVPANYGGFETLVENLLNERDDTIAVYCSAKHYPDRPAKYKNALLRYINLNANGVQSILYDVLSIIGAVRLRASALLVLGVSGAIVLPFVRIFTDVKIIVNIDGLEWKRDKWSWFAKRFLKFSEWIAVKWAHVVISDNQAIASYVSSKYRKESSVIAYGGDHVLVRPLPNIDEGYSFSVCRIEPENNVHVILEAYESAKKHLKFVGNWSASEYGMKLKEKYFSSSYIQIIEPIYDLDSLFELRSRCSSYVHGHSAGGTNPSLVEAMHFGKPILAFDCSYNRATTENGAFYFSDVASLVELLLSDMDLSEKQNMGMLMSEIACRRYLWSVVKEQYLSLCARLS